MDPKLKAVAYQDPAESAALVEFGCSAVDEVPSEIFASDDDEDNDEEGDGDADEDFDDGADDSLSDDEDDESSDEALPASAVAQDSYLDDPVI